VQRHDYEAKHIYNHVKVVQHRHVRGSNTWCGCSSHY
jgi:hypothetical protein